MNIYHLEDDLFQQLSFKKAFEANKLTDWSKLIAPDPKHLEDFWNNIANLTILDNDIFIVDIDLKLTFSGIDLASSIREKNKLCYIIFLTNDIDKGIDTINRAIYPYKYIIKSSLDSGYTELITELIKIKQMKLEDDTILKFKLGSELNLISIREINYFQSLKGFRSTAKIHLIYGQQLVEKKLAFFKALAEPFHFYNGLRDLSINIHNIKRMTATEEYIEFNNGEKLFISYRSIKKVEQFINEMF
ncbi:LytTR family transcriptional regulator DNA-binding domain-containing protein [Listeria sp. PSOL-1]|uniref:LytTR family transcriptional regulator DNA-binding domain-containing protein n=1 Tax=Listeria sp. PSOL-1 TaxID=1844999 RepID=UPI0013D72B7F|nr:LytTR family transcriptional regulator DNA-binding domain-containing protein [Listeria sp. PSOL-1]